MRGLVPYLRMPLASVLCVNLAVGAVSAEGPSEVTVAVQSLRQSAAPLVQRCQRARMGAETRALLAALPKQSLYAEGISALRQALAAARASCCDSGTLQIRLPAEGELALVHLGKKIENAAWRYGYGKTAQAVGSAMEGGGGGAELMKAYDAFSAADSLAEREKVIASLDAVFRAPLEAVGDATASSAGDDRAFTDLRAKITGLADAATAKGDPGGIDAFVFRVELDYLVGDWGAVSNHVARMWGLAVTLLERPEAHWRVCASADAQLAMRRYDLAAVIYGAAPPTDVKMDVPSLYARLRHAQCSWELARLSDWDASATVHALSEYDALKECLVWDARLQPVYDYVANEVHRHEHMTILDPYYRVLFDGLPAGRWRATVGYAYAIMLERARWFGEASEMFERAAELPENAAMRDDLIRKAEEMHAADHRPQGVPQGASKGGSP